jgi:amino acid transporter
MKKATPANEAGAAGKPKTDASEGGTLGTFSGVFTPSVLTILGIILFLRLGYVVGNAGLGKALMIIGLANAISILTSISLAAVATNLRVKGGGDYYLISRTLGVEFGGSIGLVLFLAQSVSIAFYCIGFAEAVASFAPGAASLGTPLIAFGAVGLLFVLAWLGADWASRFQFVVMALLVAALASFFWGGFSHWDSGLLESNWFNGNSTVPFWVLFAIFFPAVTGFTQGVSMSGDLKNPGKSLPLGTFMAVGISILVYFGVAVVFAATLPNAELAANYGAMKSVSRYGFLIDAGVVAATLSSAMASFMGAPRILQSLSADRIFPVLNPFAKGAGPTNNPRRGILLSAAIALVVIALGQLNLVARIVSMFFLISYGLLNYATFSEARISSPSFRPRFKWFSKHLSLLGFLTCAGVMMAIDWRSGAVAVSLLFAIYQYIKRTKKTARWADSSRSYHLQQIRTHLLEAHAELPHDTDWRPRLLILDPGGAKREALFSLASWIEGGAGLAIAVNIHEGEAASVLKERNEKQKELAGFILEHEWPIFPLTVAAPDFSAALNVLGQSVGFGPLTPNTLVLNGFEKAGDPIPCVNHYQYVEYLKSMFGFGLNIVLLRMSFEAWMTLQQASAEKRRIDVWWQNDATSRLMLLFAHLMTRRKPWSQAAIRVLVKGSESNLEQEKDAVMKMLEEVRMEAKPFIVESFDPGKVAEHSRESALVFLPFSFKANPLLDAFEHSSVSSPAPMPGVVFVLAAEDIDLDAEPEEGAVALIAEAADALEAAKARMEKAAKRAEAARSTVESLNQKLARSEDRVSAAEAPEQREDLERQVKTAEAEAEKARALAARAKASSDKAEKKAEAILEDVTTKPPPDVD